MFKLIFEAYLFIYLHDSSTTIYGTKLELQPELVKTSLRAVLSRF